MGLKEKQKSGQGGHLCESRSMLCATFCIDSIDYRCKDDEQLG